MLAPNVYIRNPRPFHYVVLSAALITFLLSIFFFFRQYWYSFTVEFVAAIAFLSSYAFFYFRQFKISLFLFIITASVAPLMASLGSPKELMIPFFYSAALIPFFFGHQKNLKIFYFGVLLPFVALYFSQNDILNKQSIDHFRPHDIVIMKQFLLLSNSLIVFLALLGFKKFLEVRDDELYLEKYRISDMIDEGLCFLTNDGLVKFINTGGQTILKLKQGIPDNCKIENILILKRPPSANSHPHPFLTFVPEIYHRGLFLTPQNNELHLEFLIRKISYHSTPEQGRVILFRDISEQINNQNQLLRSAKLSEIKNISSGVAHEINTPLSVIQLITSKLIYRGNEDEDIKKIEFMVIRIKRIIDSLLQLCDEDNHSENIQQFKACALLDDLLNLFSERLKINNIGLMIEDLGRGQEVRGNRALLSQVLFNLMMNSYQAILNLEKKWIRLTIDSNQTHLIFKVTDSGKGIPPEIKSKIFSPFFTTKKDTHGTGLGLSTSLQIITNQKGILYLNDKSPHTQFIFELPHAT